MNILYITNHLNIGGITSYILSLTRGLKKRGHHIYIASSGGELLMRFMEEGAVFVKIPIHTKKELSPGIILSMFKLSRVIREEKIDIIHSNSRTTQVLGCLLARKNNIAYLSTCHGFFKKRWLRRLFACWGQKVIAISDSVREHLVKDFGVKAQDIRVIHHGIDIEKSKVKSQKSKDELKKEWGLNAGPVVGIVARLSDVKGHIYLIQAMPQILADMPGAQLLIVGEGKMKEELIKLTCNLALQDSVFFMPAVPDTKEVFSVMDLFVMPSLEEGLGLALLEAMASGLAVVASDVGGIKSLIQDADNGILVKPADSRALTCAILALLKDSKKRESLGNQAQAFVSKCFSLDKMHEETERVYLECLKASSPG